VTEPDPEEDLRHHSMHVYCQSYQWRSWLWGISAGQLDAFMHSVVRLGAGGLFCFLNNDSRRFSLIETNSKIYCLLFEVGDSISIRMMNQFSQPSMILLF
jgi:hypothetical protein